MQLLCAALALALQLAPILASAEAATPPAANQVVITNGHQIALHIYPGGQPAVVLDAGGGLGSEYWESLIPELAKATGSEIITYDRSGFGASNEVPGPWNVMTARDDLLAVLGAANANRNVVLVSHSLAGEIALYAAKAQPGRFAGVVLVDANVPNFYTDANIQVISEAFAPVVENLKTAPRTPADRQMLALSQSFVEVSRAFHTAKWPDSVPAVVIVSEQTPFGAPMLAEAWKSAHREFAVEAGNRVLVTAEKSSHDVAHDRPDVILKAVEDLVTKAR